MTRSFIPADAQCRTNKRTGPGVPVFEDSSAGFRRALAAWEGGQSGALSTVLREAGAHDGLSLWHLLTRTSKEERGAVFDRFAGLVTLPPEVTRERILHGDARAIDLCWNALGLENTGWWRGWERKWSN